MGKVKKIVEDMKVTYAKHSESTLLICLGKELGLDVLDDAGALRGEMEREVAILDQLILPPNTQSQREREKTEMELEMLRQSYVTKINRLKKI